MAVVCRRSRPTRSVFIQSAIRNPQSVMTPSHPCPRLEYQRIPDVDIRHERRREPEHQSHVVHVPEEAGSALRASAGLGAPSLNTCACVPVIALRVSTTSFADSTTRL